MVNEYKTIRCRLDGKQTVSIPVDFKKNGRYVTDALDVIVRGFVKFSDSSNNTTENKTVVYPVLFTTNKIRVNNGRCIITLLPRSEDLFEETKVVSEGAAISNDDIFANGGVRTDEQITNPAVDPVVIKIETGVIRSPYKLSIEVTAVGVDSGGIYARTVDRGTSPQINTNNNVSSLFQKNKTRSPSNIIIDCYNDVDWVPIVDNVLGANNSSSSDILDKIDKLKNSTPFGISTMYDAVVSGARILSDADVNDLRKTIYLFTDNESNVSIASLENAIEEVNDIDGNKKVPVLIANMSTVDPPTLSVKANSSDTKNINRLSFLTGGQALTITDVSYQSDVVGIFYREAVGAMGYGTYEFVIDLEEEVLINNISLLFDILEIDSNASWSIGTSLDGYNYTYINTTYSYSDSTSFDNLYARYIKFKIILIMSINDVMDEYGSYPESPSLTGVQIIYNAYKVAYLYLNKEDASYRPYQMVVSVDANDVNDGQIEVGLSKSDSNNWDDYSTASQPTVDQNGKIVVPIRFSQDINEFQQEPLHKVDKFTLKTEYGSFDPYASVVVYDSSDNVISSNYYVVRARDGFIIFNYALPTDYVDGDYKIGIINQGEYKIGLKLNNRSIDKSLEIYGVGYLYTTGKDLLPPLAKSAPEVLSQIITDELPNKFSIIEASYTYYDSNFEPENKNNRIIKWFINGSPISYLNNIIKWNDITDPADPIYVNTSLSYPDDLGDETIDVWIKKQNISILKAGDKVHFEIQVSDGTLMSNKYKSDDVVVVDSMPVVDQIVVMAEDASGNIINRLSTDMKVIIYPPIDEVFYSDSADNQSEIIWYVNDEIFKRGIYGQEVLSGQPPIHEIWVNEIGRENYVDYGLRIGNTIVVQIIPKAGGIYGDPVTSPSVNNVVQNSYPVIFDAAYVRSVHDKNNDIILTWSFYDFEINAIGDVDTTSQSDQTSVEWYRKQPGEGANVEATLVYIYNDHDNNLKENFIENDYRGNITTSLGTHTSVINNNILLVGQKWYAKIIPHDSIDAGEAVITSEITITSAV